MTGRQLLELLARLPARVWLQGALGLLGLIVLAVLGFAVIAGVAAVALLAIFAFKAKEWLRGFLSNQTQAGPPARGRAKITDVSYEIVERKDDRPQ